MYVDYLSIWDLTPSEQVIYHQWYGRTHYV